MGRMGVWDCGGAEVEVEGELGEADGEGFFLSSDMFPIARASPFVDQLENRIKDLSIRYDLFGRAVISETI